MVGEAGRQERAGGVGGGGAGSGALRRTLKTALARPLLW
jgi:hypothetical protein